MGVYGTGDDMKNQYVGDVFVITKSDGTIVTIQNRADGQIQIESSATPNTTTIRTVDSFCNYMGF